MIIDGEMSSRLILRGYRYIKGGDIKDRRKLVMESHAQEELVNSAGASQH